MNDRERVLKTNNHEEPDKKEKKGFIDRDLLDNPEMLDFVKDNCETINLKEKEAPDYDGGLLVKEEGKMRDVNFTAQASIPVHYPSLFKYGAINKENNDIDTVVTKDFLLKKKKKIQVTKFLKLFKSSDDKDSYFASK